MNPSRTRSSAVAAIAQYFRSTFTSLRHRNFRYYCLGVVASLTGSLLQEVVVAWLAYQKTGSSFVLGSILFSYQVPMIAMGVFGGWAADRFNRKRILQVTQSLALCLSLTWLALAVTGGLTVWHMYALSALFGTVVAFEIPARFAMIPQLVDGDDCMNAFSLDSLLFYGGRVLGPAAGALVLATAGATICFGLNSLSYVFELFTLTRMQPATQQRSPHGSLKQGFAHTWGNKNVRAVLILVAVLTFCGIYIPLMPMFTALLHGTATTNGLLIAASELGATIGSIVLANKTSSAAYAAKLKTTVGFAAITFAVCLALFSLSGSVALSMALIMPAGFSMTLVLIGSHALVQNEVGDEVRGVASTVFWMYSYFGMLALGGPTIGLLAEHLGVAVTEIGACLCCIAAALYYLRARRQADAQA